METILICSLFSERGISLMLRKIWVNQTVDSAPSAAVAMMIINRGMTCFEAVDFPALIYSKRQLRFRTNFARSCGSSCTYVCTAALGSYSPLKQIRITIRTDCACLDACPVASRRIFVRRFSIRKHRFCWEGGLLVDDFFSVS